MSDIKSKGTRTAPWLALMSILLGLALFPPPCFATDVEVTIFGPKQYLRTTNNPFNSYSDSFRGVRGKGKAIIQNGDGTGNNRVSNALVLINGVPIYGVGNFFPMPFAPAKTYQPGSILETPIQMDENNQILVLLAGEPGSYLTIQAAAEITPDATSTQVIGIAGGTVSVQNHLGDTFTLQIPPLALDTDMSISLSALPKTLPSQIAHNTYPGVILGPSDLHFSLPVKIDVSPHTALQNPNAAILYWFIDSQHILPIANQSPTQNGMEGETYHFSPPVVLGEMSCEDIEADEQWISVDEPIHTPCQLADTYDGMMSLAHTAKDMHCTWEYYAVLRHAKSLVEVQTPELLAEPLPKDPCGANTICVQRWADLVSSVLGQTSEAQEIINDKACKFSVSPQYLFLDLGETWKQGIEATLLDPNGTKEVCGITGWYSSNLNVVDIADSGMVCFPTGVGPGVANVSANCDGLLASTKVSVCSLSGTYQGEYSGSTIGKDGKPKYFSGTVAVPFTQNGTSISAVIMGYDVTGTNDSGNVSLGPIQVPCDQGTSLCPAWASATLSSDCSTLSGSFFIARPRPISGTFLLRAPAP